MSVSAFSLSKLQPLAGLAEHLSFPIEVSGFVGARHQVFRFGETLFRAGQPILLRRNENFPLFLVLGHRRRSLWRSRYLTPGPLDIIFTGAVYDDAANPSRLSEGERGPMLASDRSKDIERKIKEYLEEAADCENRADRSTTAEGRLYWQELADRWRTLVVQFREKKP